MSPPPSATLTPLTRSAAALLFAGGCCALVYQTMWIRELRAVFGASTPSSSAVLAIFMGGLGLGAYMLARRVDSSVRPMRVYAALELATAAAAAATPALVWLVDRAYRAMGGSSTLGALGATPVRLVLAALAIGAPAFFMGGTLPAMARAVITPSDRRRAGLALLYGMNAVGAVLGSLLSTFVLLDLVGVRTSIWLAAIVNASVGAIAWSLAASMDDVAPAPPRARRPSDRTVLALSFAVGFAFFVLEMSWFRVSAPILGSSTFTYGAVIAVALAGLGIGGALYWVAPPRAPDLGWVSVTCALEAAAALVPLAAGDSLARLAFFLRELGLASFPTVVGGWLVVAAILVLPPALVSGYQFPLLLAAKGAADERVSADTGDVYAANTVGAIAGSLAGGFLLLPALGVVGLWRLACVMLLAVAALAAIPRTSSMRQRGLAAVLALGAGALALFPGPSALWRHAGVGGGRVDLHARSAFELEALRHDLNRGIVDQRDGVEASLAISQGSELALLVNGKSDAGALSDGANVVALGLLPALLQGGVERAFVVGLGSGETAGWIAALPSVQRVDVAEIEPGVERFARLCAPMNRAALDNPKVKLRIGDGRELLATSPERYDLIVSEPSNPYRAGVADFYTADFYRDVDEHLAGGGVFAQWLQAYEIDVEALRSVLETLRRRFPFVTVWRPEAGDLILVATREGLPLDAALLAERLGTEPFATAFARVLRLSGPEGLLATFVAGPDSVTRLAEGAPENTDDRPFLELSFARTVGVPRGDPMTALAFASPPPVLGALDRARLDGQRARPWVADWSSPGGDSVEGAWSVGAFERAASLMAVEAPASVFDATGAVVREHLMSLRPLPEEHRGPVEQTLRSIEDSGLPTEAALIRAHHAITAGDERMVERVARALELARADPWPHISLTRSLFERLQDARLSPALAARLHAELALGPLAGMNAERFRLLALHALGRRAAAAAPPLSSCGAAYLPVEPHPFWTLGWLEGREACYRAHHPELHARAAADLERARREAGSALAPSATLAP